MDYRRFGRTELQMPVFSCGGMRYQDGWQDKPLAEIDSENQNNLNATITAALGHGINHIETARGYGPSERQLGVILPTLPREQLIIQTKIGPTDDPEEFLKHFDESLDRLKLEHVDLLGIHGINDQETFERSTRPGGCLAAARKLQKQKRVRHVGFSTHGTRDIILRAIEHEGDGGFDYVNLHWYYIFQHNWPAVVEATRRDMGVFIISPTDKGGKLYAPPAKLTKLCDPLHPMVFNDLFCLSRPEVHTLSIGASCPGDFDRHLEALPLLADAQRGQAALLEITDRLRHAMRDATGIDHPEGMSWDLPDHREAPEGLNLPLMLWLRNLAVGWDMHDYAKMRFNLMGHAGHWFPGEKPQVIDDVSDAVLAAAASASPFAERVPALLREAVTILGGEDVQRASQGG